jgi:hypothetical protein
LAFFTQKTHNLMQKKSIFSPKIGGKWPKIEGKSSKIWKNHLKLGGNSRKLGENRQKLGKIVENCVS